MKNYFLLILTAFAIISCSKQGKAEALAKQETLKCLYFPDSYDPIETKLDSVFAPRETQEMLSLASDLNETYGRCAEYYQQIKEINKTLSFYDDSSFWDNDRNERLRDKEEKLSYYRADSLHYVDVESQMINKLKQEPSFVGYRIYHKFRSKTNSGNTVIDELVIYTDENIEQAVSIYGIGDLNKLLNTISRY